MPNWDEIRKEFESTKITLATLAEKYDVKLGTLKSRKSREGWSRGSPKKDATKSKKVATINKKDATVKREIKQEKEPFVESGELTDKQRLFCIYYVKSFNATQSAIKAGYAVDSAHVTGSQLLRNPKVAAEIKRIKGNMMNELYIDAMDVLQKWVKIAFADITDFATFGKKEVEAMGPFGPIQDEDGNPVMVEVNYVDFKESSEVDGSIITEVKKGKDGVSIKLADKMKALDKLSLYFDLFPDKFKRQIEEEKLKIAHHKVFSDDDNDEYEDDGFEEALDATTSEVWGNVDDTTEEAS
ncbi:terminase small subunit [Bacillus sp. FJAT-49736]|uniref:terminase small subunit n=1 Tax=Bacillus sp. FJAT-49736 TaxID=2833582 RepID=UPI001BCA5D02|nr:terminase small subunit [Bacillus sp. FJAT-49736]MBS4172110.1 terminase small subunit [Bacillus sp. FJAT-49736]